MKYVVLIENKGGSYGAYVPDLPGCVAVGDSADAVTNFIRESVELHLQAMRADGDPIPAPTTIVRELEVA